MYSVINMVNASIVIGMLFSVDAYAYQGKRLLAKHIESNEITESKSDGSVRLIKITKSNCLKMMNGLVADLQRLSKFIPAGEIEKTQWLQKKVIRFDRKYCDKKNSRQTMFQLASSMIRNHSQKIAVLLPLSNYNASFSQSFKMGIQRGSGLSAEDFAKKFVFLDTMGNALGTDQAMARAYFVHNASMVVGGMSLLEAQKISHWSGKVLMPSLITNHDASVIKGNKRGFLVFPNLENMFKGVVEAMKNQNLKKLAILYPNSASNLELMKKFAVAMEQSGIEVLYKATYSPNDYQSMEAAAKRIFEIDVGARRAEYNRIYRRLKRKARRAGTKFNTRLVSLSPRVNMDAVFIADHFKSVRYMAKIFEFLGVQKMRLFGNQQWRAKSLVDPWDPFLDGAHFVDYVGSYASLPTGLQDRNPSSPYFVNPNQAQHIDFKLIGYLSGSVSAQALSWPDFPRSQWHSKLAKTAINEPRFFGKRQIFLNNRSSNWPYFKFLVGAKTLHLAH